jgi:TIR domain
VGLPTLGQKSTSVTYTNFAVYEQGQLKTSEALQQLIRRKFLEPETEIRYYYRDGTEIDAMLAEATHHGDIVLEKSEFRFFRDPKMRRDYIKIKNDEEDETRREIAETTPEFVQVTLRLSARKRAELETINKVHLEEQIRGELKRQKCSFDVFLSYSDADRGTSALIHGKISSAGGRIFMAPKEISPGDDFAERIREALVHSLELWLLVSARSVRSEWVISEWGAAWALEKRIVPILYQCDRAALPERLRRIQTVDLRLIDQLVAERFGKSL